MPFQPVLLPLCKPVEFSTGLDEELHLHLLELPHPENELTGDDLVSESLPYLGYTERYLHPSCLLDIQIIDEYSLCSFRTKIDYIGVIRSVSELGAEHQVELTHIRPVLRA